MTETAQPQLIRLPGGSFVSLTREADGSRTLAWTTRNTPEQCLAMLDRLLGHRQVQILPGLRVGRPDHWVHDFSYSPATGEPGLGAGPPAYSINFHEVNPAAAVQFLANTSTEEIAEQAGWIMGALGLSDIPGSGNIDAGYDRTGRRTISWPAIGSPDSVYDLIPRRLAAGIRAEEVDSDTVASVTFEPGPIDAALLRDTMELTGTSAVKAYAELALIELGLREG